MPSAKDLREFRGFLRNATDRQVQGIYDKERRAGRDDYAELAVEEAERRGVDLDQISHSTMKTDRYDVIESKVWKRDDGATASPYGASPWTSTAEEKRWKLVTRGYTVRDNESGTVGIGRVPWATRAEAQEWVDTANARRAAQLAAHEARYPKKTPGQLQREINEALEAKRKRRR